MESVTSRPALARITTMPLEPREPVVAESYPTFWDEQPQTPVAHLDPAEDAYATFVNLTEDELPVEAGTDDE
jgi:hypothetical protein